MAKMHQTIIAAANELGYFPNTKQADRIWNVLSLLVAKRQVDNPLPIDKTAHDRLLKQAIEQTIGGRVDPTDANIVEAFYAAEGIVNSTDDNAPESVNVFWHDDDFKVTATVYGGSHSPHILLKLEWDDGEESVDCVSMGHAIDHLTTFTINTMPRAVADRFAAFAQGRKWTVGKLA